MAVLTTIDLEAARRIGREHGVSITNVSGIFGGSVNTNYECSLEGGGRVFLRLYEEQGAEAAARELRLLDHLASRGVPTPRPLSRSEDDRGQISVYSGKPAALFPWIEGEILCQRSVTEDVMAQLGRALARVHA